MSIEKMARKSVSVLDLSIEDLRIFQAWQARLRPGLVGRVTMTRILIDKNDAAAIYAQVDERADGGTTIAMSAITDEAAYLLALQIKREKDAQIVAVAIDHKKEEA